MPFVRGLPAPPAGISGAELHIPDGFLSLAVALACWLLTAALVGLAVRRTQGELGERQVPLMGVMAAFIFAAQMINFPVAGGTSGHLLGGALAAIALGPWAGMLVMASVVGVQALLFQDGGLLAMGANILNMGVLTALVGFGLYRSVLGRRLGLRLGAAGVAAWLSVMAGALATALQLWLSGAASLALVIPAMLGVHALIGIGEALITVAALAFISRTRPDLIAPEQHAAGGYGWVVASVGVTLVVLLLAPLASVDPDGLERVAQDLGFIARAEAPPASLLPDYTVPFLGSTPLSTIAAGALGALAVAGATLLLARAIRRGERKPPRPETRPS
ncbi:MAG TPA: energy-coupling factor ABC transporter permease [Roseiflexaceae bacterium]|nr:energy-coupling factor ABC transporter permease [Roseiflexaceae bacterium]